MSNAIANSFALLNEIRQELNQTKATNLRNISKSPSPKKMGGLSSSSASLKPNTNANPLRSSSVHKPNKFVTKPYEKTIDNALDRYSPENYEETLQMKKKSNRPSENYESAKNEPNEKPSENHSSELILKLKEKIDNEIKCFSSSCDEITSKINDLIKNIDNNNSDVKEHKIIDEESDDESDEENEKYKKKLNYSNDNNKQKYVSNLDEKNLFKSLNESFNKIVQNLDNKKYDYLGKKLNS